MRWVNSGYRFMMILGAVFVLAACGPSGEGFPAGEGGSLQVAASTTFIGDIVGEIAGEDGQLTVLLEPGQNPHAYQPTPRDVALVSEAEIFFVNGFQLEGFLDDLLTSSGSSESVVVVSEGIEPLMVGAHDHQEDRDQAGEDHADDGPDHLENGGQEGEDHADNGPDHQENDGHTEGGQRQEGLGQDPHVWLDPNNVMVWAENIASSLAEADPEHAGEYQERGEAYIQQLVELDDWIRARVETIPPENRKLVTDHTSFGYFAEEYGFEQIGAVVPAPTTEAETSGQQLADLVDTIRETGVRVIFVSADIDPSLAERIAEDTGVEVVSLYFGSLTAGEPAGTYLDFMRYNVETIVAALK